MAVMVDLGDRIRKSKRDADYLISAIFPTCTSLPNRAS
jgi:hypothetical protein